MSISAINFEPAKNSNSLVSKYLLDRPQVSLSARQNVATNPLLSQESNYRPSEKADDANSHKLHDEILPNDIITKFKTGIETAASIPEYAVRGLKGDPDSNFYEYLQLGKLPYYIGGPMLAYMFLAGKSGNVQSNLFTIAKAKQMAAGVVLYYAAAAIANKLIDAPVKYFRGIDLNQPYRDVVDLRATSASGISPKKKEYHTVFESMDFTRFDLMYGENDKKLPGADKTNENFNKIAKKYGIDKDSNDSDSTLKSYIQSTIAMTRAWKYALTVPLVALALGMAKQDVWSSVGVNLKEDFRIVFSSTSKSNMVYRFKKAISLIHSNTTKPLKNSFVSFWNGVGKGSASSIVGKTVILASVLLPLYANFRILQRSSAKNEKVVDVSQPQKNKAIGG